MANTREENAAEMAHDEARRSVSTDDLIEELAALADSQSQPSQRSNGILGLLAERQLSVAQTCCALAAGYAAGHSLDDDMLTLAAELTNNTDAILAAYQALHRLSRATADSAQVTPELRATVDGVLADYRPGDSRVTAGLPAAPKGAR